MKVPLASDPCSAHGVDLGLEGVVRVDRMTLATRLAGGVAETRRADAPCSVGALCDDSEDSFTKISPRGRLFVQSEIALAFMWRP